ncbi:MAG: tetratricopeptide repeat protein, partial [Methanobacteriota archaeon]
MFRVCLIVSLIAFATSCTTTDATNRNLPDSPFAGISESLLLGDPGQAINSYEQAFKNNPGDIRTRILHVRLLILASRYDEARGLLEGILKESPENPDAMFALALLEGVQGNAAKQKEILEAI